MSAPASLGLRGKTIWAAYSADNLPGGHRALVHEACRLADTLDKLDSLIGADASVWATLVFDDMGQVELSIDSLMSERRQQQLAFKQVMGEIRMAGIKQTGGKAIVEESDGRGGLILDITSRLG